MFIYSNYKNFTNAILSAMTLLLHFLSKLISELTGSQKLRKKFCGCKHLPFTSIAFVCCIITCKGQFDEADFEQHTVKEGLSDNNVTTLYQDSLGYIWIGTEMGLNSFDGKTFRHFFSGKKPLDLPGMYIVKIVPFSNARMGVITRRGLQVVNTKGLSAESYRFPDTSYFSVYQNALLDAFELPDKSVVLCSRAGLYTFDKPGHVNFRYDVYPVADPTKEPLVYGQAVTMLTENEALIYTVANGLDHYNAPKKELHHITDTSAEKFNAFFPDKIFGTTATSIADGQFIIFDRYKDSLTFYDRSLNKKVTSSIPCMLREEINWESRVFVTGTNEFAITGSRNGYYVFHVNKTSGVINCDGGKYLPSYKCNWLLIDKESRLWVGTRTGLLKQKQNTSFLQSWNYNKESKPGFRLRLSSICRYKGRLYAGSYNRYEGLFVIDTVNMQVIKKITFFGGDNGWSEIGSVQCYHKDTLWIGTINGLLWLDVNSYSYGYVLDQNKDSVMLNAEPVFWPPDKKGRAWFCDLMNGKTGYYDTSKRTFSYFNMNKEPRVPFAGIKHIVYDSYNNTWIAGHGLARWNDLESRFDTVTFSYAGPNKFSDDILAITADKKGSLWLFNTENVLLEYNIKEGKFYQHNAGEGLPEFVQSMADNVSNNLWFTTGTQLICYDLVTRKIVYFDQSDGLPLERSSSRSIFFDGERNCFYSLHNDHIAVFPGSIAEIENRQKQLLITEIAFSDTIFYNPSGTITLQYRQNNFSLHFTVLDYSRPEKYNYFYKLDGKDWINLDGYPVIFFNSLRTGSHMVEIKASSKFGIDFITTLQLSVAPAFWQTWWFTSFIVFLVAAIIYVLYSYRISQLKRFFIIREKISRDLHDEVGSTLSGIAMYSHLAKEQVTHFGNGEVEKSLNIMQQSAREMVNKLNDIVWLINPAQDSLKKLIQRLEEYAHSMAIIKSMQLNIQVAEHLPEHSLPMESRRNIYLFCKEAINNAIKYSDGTRLDFIVKETNGVLEFTVTDNGTGFDKASIQRGNGLNNMQKRANEIGAKFTIHAKKEEGTMLSLKIKIT